MGWLWSKELGVFYFMWPTWFVALEVIALILLALKLFKDNYPRVNGEKS